MPPLDPVDLTERWRARCEWSEGGRHGDWPDVESERLVGELATAVESPTADPGGGAALDRAARAWAGACPAMATMLLRLAQLRSVLADETARETVPGRTDRVRLLVDAVTIAANEQAGSILENAALTDPLTGAGNRRALAREAALVFSQAQSVRAPVCVVAIDLDGLKRTNDTLGHEAGDRAIVSLASCIRRALRDTDRLYRTGGDEFVVLAPGAPEAFANDLVSRVRAFLAPRFSWGAADTLDGRTFEEVLAVADRRLYSARRAERMMAEPPGTIGGRPPSHARETEVPARLAHWDGAPGWRGAAAWAVTGRRPLDLLLGGVAAVIVGVVVLLITAPGAVACGGGACRAVDVVRVAAYVAVVAGGISFAGGVVASALRRP